MTTASDTTVVRDLTFPQPPEAVWKALTDTNALAAWLMPNDIKPEVGHNFEFRGQAYGDWDGVIHCEVLESVPNERLVYTWASLGIETTVTFELTPDAGGTRVHFEQTGFDETQTQNKQGAEYGWNAFFQKLTEVLAK
ncbi:MAG: SRPBCC domain-containing protein [Chloroflexi bacterium]|nr:MAG: SRPBCC domain-containing protein [Chloroflexota bacterium]